MRILGLESVVYGVEQMAEAQRFCGDFGLTRIEGGGEDGAVFETQDGSTLVLRPIGDPALPAPFHPGPTLRQVVWGVPDLDAIEEIRVELAKDRPAHWDGERLQSTDDIGLSIAFQPTRKRAYQPRLPAANIPGHFQRPANTRIDFERDVKPLSIAHVVLNCAEEERARRFYIDRLGFILSDEFRNAGAFIRTRLAREHHSVFTVQRTPTALNHVAFYVTDFHDVMLGGKHMTERGWSTMLGPGRHKLGSNYYWYFKTPLGGALEYTCDVDHVTEDWVPGLFEFSPEMTSIWSAKDFPAV